MTGLELLAPAAGYIVGETVKGLFQKFTATKGFKQGFVRSNKKPEPATPSVGGM